MPLQVIRRLFKWTPCLKYYDHYTFIAPPPSYDTGWLEYVDYELDIQQEGCQFLAKKEYSH
jgi:hypothetical protein